MMMKEPLAEIDSDFSSADATPVPWAEARTALEKAEIFWLSTVRPDGRPHVTPLVAVWSDSALYFCTGESERKNKNIEENSHCILTTGCSSFKEGLDLVVEGAAVRVSDEARLNRLAGLWQSKYGWPWTVRNGMFHGDEGNDAIVYELRPVTTFGFGHGTTYTHTRWRF